MARFPRYFVKGVPLHIILRGNKREPIFGNDEDCQFFRASLLDAAKRQIYGADTEVSPLKLGYPAWNGSDGYMGPYVSLWLHFGTSVATSLYRRFEGRPQGLSPFDQEAADSDDGNASVRMRAIMSKASWKIS
jgi:hypothetical protein